MNSDIFAQLLDCARETLETSPKTPFSQAIALKTAKGNTYCFSTPSFTEEPEAFAAAEDRILSALQEREERGVEALVTMWADGCVDLPSYRFREKLLALDPCNRETEILLLAAEGAYATRSIGTCMPEK